MTDPNGNPEPEGEPPSARVPHPLPDSYWLRHIAVCGLFIGMVFLLYSFGLALTLWKAIILIIVMYGLGVFFGRADRYDRRN